MDSFPPIFQAVNYREFSSISEEESCRKLRQRIFDAMREGYKSGKSIIISIEDISNKRAISKVMNELKERGFWHHIGEKYIKIGWENKDAPYTVTIY